MKLIPPPSLALVVSLGLAGVLLGGACGNSGRQGATPVKGSAAAVPPGTDAAKAAPAADVKVFVDTSVLRPAPGFTLPDTAGKPHSLADYRGKVVFLNFWATWCPPCRAEIPAFIRLYKQYKDRGFTVVGVSLDARGKADAAPFVRAKEIPYPILLDPRAAVAPDYGGVRGIPTTFIITQDGRIYDKIVGGRDEATFERYIRTLLGMETESQGK
jgi:peroxiredoxin